MTARADIDAARFQRDGFLFPIDIMSRTEAAKHRAEVEGLEARFATAGALPRTTAKYFRINAHLVVARVASLSRDPRILDAVEAVLGRDLLVWSSELFIKEAGTQKIVTWHQDLAYWGLGATDDEVTAWLALSPSTPHSGCMRFVAGSHKNDILPHHDTFAADNLLSRGQVLTVAVDEAEATDVMLEPGQMSLHHGRMFHSSGPNRSAERRIGLAIRYITPAVRQHVGDRDYAMPVRGTDSQRHFVHVEGASADFAAADLTFYEQVLADKAKALGQGAEQGLNLYRPS